MLLDTKRFTLAAAIASVIIWLFCSLIVFLFPEVSMRVTGDMMHSDFSMMSWQLTPLGVIVGLLGWVVTASLCACLLATIYNKFG